MIRCKNCFNEYEEKYNVCPHCGYYEDMQEDPLYRLPHGTLLNNRYVIGATLGIGGFGITYKAWDKKLEKIVAVKEYYPHSIVNRIPGTKDIILVDKKSIAVFKFGYNRLLDEARYVARMKGKDNIVGVYTFFEENNTSYMVMEYVKGVQLRKIVAARGKLGVEEAVDITVKVCDALRVCKEEKIIHRDVAPDNIMIDTDNNNAVKLIDFGNARFQGADELNDIVVKEGFSPVEQYESVNKQGAWTDVYALGATLYYALTGIKPDESRVRKEEDKVISPNEIDSSIPVNISNAVMRAMAVEAHLRYQSVEEFKKDLTASMEHGSKKVLTVREVVKKKKKKRRLTIAAAVVVLLIGVTFFCTRYMTKRAEEHLPYDTTITVWISGDDNGNKELAFNEMVKDFVEAYAKDNIEVELVIIPQDEYLKKLDKAAASGTLPEVFENTRFDGTYKQYTQSVTKLSKNIKEEVHFSKSISSMAKENEVMIIGFDMPVLYVNTILSEEDIDTYDSLLNKLKVSDVSKYTDKKGFLQGKEVLYCGYSSDYAEVQAALPAQYKLISLPKGLSCSYAMGFSISTCGNKETKVAQRFVETLYSDSAGDKLFIQVNTSVLPVNKNDLTVYEEVYPEYKGFFDAIDTFKLN